MNRQDGLTLIELLVAIAIVGILSAIAIPAYQGYVQTAREGVLVQNIDTMRIFQENWRIENGNYHAFIWAPGDGMTDIGWLPEREGSNVTYTVVIPADCTNCYEVTAADQDSAISVTRRLP